MSWIREDSSAIASRGRVSFRWLTIIFAGLTGLFLLVSCDRRMVYDQYSTIEGDGWTWSEVQDFAPVIEDTLAHYNVYLQVRHKGTYPVSNLYMFVHLIGPNGQTATDTVNFILAAPDGQWTGKGLGDMKELRLLYRKNIRFPEAGTYGISIEQGMRIPSVPVVNVGVRIEKSEE